MKFNKREVQVIPVTPLQLRSGSARRNCTWRACGQMRSQTRQKKSIKVKMTTTATDTCNIKIMLDFRPCLWPTGWCAL